MRTMIGGRGGVVGVILALAAAVALGCGDTIGPAPESIQSVPPAPSFAASGTFDEIDAEPFGTFDGVDFTLHKGFFEGETSAGAFRVPFEIVAPADPSEGRAVVMVEPSHFAYRTVGRDVVLGADEVHGRGMSHAAVGWSTNQFSILDPWTGPVMIAGESEGQDPEILLEFARALRAASFATDLLGEDLLLYGYGASQTAAALLNVLLTPGAAGVFDLSFLNVGYWPAIREPEVFDRLTGEFEPIDGIGKVIFLETESELVLSDAEQFRNAVGHPDYRVYEVAGAAHLPGPANPLNWTFPAEALWAAADAWVAAGTPPPPSRLITAGATDADDPIYGDPTGIARDPDGNALGGIRLPSLAVRRALFIATDPTTPGPPGFDALTGNMVDLSCEPYPETADTEPRFRRHGEYVSGFSAQANALRGDGFLLPEDAETLKEQASTSNIGKPGSC